MRCVSVRIKYADALHAVFLNITSCNGGFAMAKSLKKSAKRAADDRQQDPSAANIDPRTEERRTGKEAERDPQQNHIKTLCSFRTPEFAEQFGFMQEKASAKSYRKTQIGFFSALFFAELSVFFSSATVLSIRTITMGCPLPARGSIRTSSVLNTVCVPSF